MTISALTRKLREGNPQLGLPELCLFDAATAHDSNTHLTDFNDHDEYNRKHDNYHQKIGESCHLRPFGSNEDLRSHRQEVRNQVKNSQDSCKDYWGNRRNIAIGEVVPRQMEAIGSKKGIIVIGGGHVFNQITELPMHHENKLQRVLPYSSLAINATGKSLSRY